jgi:hypothetical protein
MRHLTGSRKRKKATVAVVVVLLLWSCWFGWREVSRSPSLSESGLASSLSWPDFAEDGFFIHRFLDPVAPASSNEDEDGLAGLPENPAITETFSNHSIDSRGGSTEPTGWLHSPALAAVDRERILESVFGDAREEEGPEIDEAIDSAIQSCARNRSLDLVFDTSFRMEAGSPFVFSGDRIIDLTDEVIATLSKQSNLPAKTPDDPQRTVTKSL